MGPHSRKLVTVLVLALVTGWSAEGVAGGAHWPIAPDTDDDRLDLAAMALDADDLPEVPIFPEYQEYSVTIDAIAANFAGTPITPEEVRATGLLRQYETYYRGADGVIFYRSYILEFGSPEEVAAGFALFEDEVRMAAVFAPNSELRDLPLPDGGEVGEEPREVTVGIYRPEPCCDAHDIDITFRVGRLLVGVGIGAPDYAEPPDQAVALALAARLEERVQQVLAGESPSGIVPGLRELVLPIAETWPEPGANPEGYLTLGEAFGIQKPLVGFREDYQGGYSVTVTPGWVAATNLPPPTIVTIAVLRLDNGIMAEMVLKLAEFLPRPAPYDIHQWKPAGWPEIAGVRHTIAFTGPRYADAYQVGIAVGNYVARVWVEGSEDAEAIALDLAAQQAVCLAAEGPCDALVVPAALAAPGA